MAAQNIPAFISQYAHRPRNMIVFDTDEFVFLLLSVLCMVPLTLLFGARGFAEPAFAWPALYLYFKAKRKHGRGFFQRLLHRVGLINVSGAPPWSAKRFRS